VRCLDYARHERSRGVLGKEAGEKKTLIQTFSREGREKASKGGLVLASITALANIS
jgi:hypothetical protein